MNIKIQCPCGQAFAFDVEPVSGAMPCAVSCPACGADATQLANQAIIESQFTPPPAAAPPASGLRINRGAPAPAAVSAPVDQPQRYGYTRTLEPDKAPPPSKEHIPMGIVGGLAAAFIAMLIWYSLTVATDMEFGIVAWGVGVLAGVGVRTLGRDGTQMLGFIAAVCACFGILGGKFLVTSHYTNKYMKVLAAAIYEKNISEARKAVSLKTDSEINAWLDDNRENKSGLFPKDADEFNATRRARMQDFLDGKPSQSEFEKNLVARLSTQDIKFKIFRDRITLFTVLWLVVGIASAYRIGSS